ncbi:ATP-binding cassette domain-containing protein [Lactobacillus sanfranciscensis]|nr:ATP-binding cassette domain-containing protein [Fructilactobacillus sanfranciscensis]
MRFGFLGHNGAGKSTTLKSLTSIIEPTSVKIYFDGLDLAQHRTEIKHESNYNVVFAIIVALLTLIFYLGSIFILTSLLTFLITQNRIFQTHKHIGNSLLLGVSTLAIVIGCILFSVLPKTSLTLPIKQSSVR